MKRRIWIPLLLGCLMFACNPDGQKVTASEVFQQAQTAHAESRFGDAVRLYSAYVTEFADSAEAAKCQFMIAYLYANELDQKDQAKTAYETFISRYPNSELLQSAQWELEHLGQNLSEIDLIPDTGKGTEPAGTPEKAPEGQ